MFCSSVFAQQDQQPGDEDKGWPCGKKIDPSYIEVAEGSGGQVLMLDPSESSKSMVLLEAQLKGIEETVFRAGGQMSGVREYEFPVDSTIEVITFSVFVQCIESIAILLPDRSEFKPGQGGPEDHVFRSGRVFTLERPVPGNWKVRVSGKGFHSVLVFGKTDLALIEFDFVKPGGRPGHEGYFPTHEIPVPNAQQMVSLELSGTREAQVKLVSSSGKEIRQIQISESIPSDDSIQLYGVIEVPAEPFRILVEGTDTRGFRWQRFDPRLWSAKSEKQP
jgi:hypothetical protein